MEQEKLLDLMSKAAMAARDDQGIAAARSQDDVVGRLIDLYGPEIMEALTEDEEDLEDLREAAQAAVQRRPGTGIPQAEAKARLGLP